MRRPPVAYPYDPCVGIVSGVVGKESGQLGSHDSVTGGVEGCSPPEVGSCSRCLPGPRRWSVGLGVSGGLFLLFVLITWWSVGGPLHDADGALDRWLFSLSHPGWAYFFSLATELGGWELLAGVVAIIGVLVRRRGGWPWVVALAVAAGGGALVDELLKRLIARPRPLAPLEVARGYSFPSGHVMMAVGFYGMCIWFALGSQLSRRTKALVIVAAGLAMLLVGVSRVYLRAHWLSDALAGYAAGGAWLVLCVVALAPPGRSRSTHP